MARGLPALALAMVLALVVRLDAGQTLTVLHIKVSLVDAEGKSTPVPRHPLLVSDNPATAPPRRIFTTLEGTADVRLRPGNYTVESDQPAVFQGKAYQWTETLDVVEALPEMAMFSSDYPHQEGNADPINAYGDALQALDAVTRERFMGRNAADAYTRMGDPL